MNDQRKRPLMAPPGLGGRLRAFSSADLLLTAILAAAGVWVLQALPDQAPRSAEGRALIDKAVDIGSLLIAAAAVAMFAPLVGRFVKTPQPNLASAFPVAASPRPRAFILLCVPALLAVAFCLNRILATKTGTIAGARFFWLDDDMMISMRYAMNLARGEGLRWNPGEPPVEGYSNFLWTLVMAIPHLLYWRGALPLRLTSAAVLVINVALLIGVLVMSERVARRFGLGPAARWLALILIATNKWLIYWTVAGSEAILLAFALLAIVDRLLGATRGRPAGWPVGLLIGALALIRADGLAAWVGLAPALWFLYRSGRVRPSLLAVLPLPFVAHLLGRYLYYGDWLPNTYYLKVADIPMKSAMGVHYILWLFYYWGGIAALQLMSLRCHRRPGAAWLALLPWSMIAYAALAGGDELPYQRFLVPIVPLMALGAVVSLDRLLLRARRARGALGSASRFGRMPGGWALAALALAAGGFDSYCLPRALEDLGRERATHEKRNVRVGLALKANTGSNARIAHYWAGAAPYFSERFALDALGKSDRYIARLPGRAGEWQPGHVKYDSAYTLGQKPDVIVTALPADRRNAGRRARDPNRPIYPALYDIFGEPGFVEDYASRLVPLPISQDFHGIYVRRGTRRATRPGSWREPLHP